MQTAHNIAEIFQVFAGIFVLGAIVYTIIANRREEGEPSPEDGNWLGPEGVEWERRHREEAANDALNRIVVRVVSAENRGHPLNAEAWRAVSEEIATNKVGIRWLNQALEQRSGNGIEESARDAILFGIQMAWRGHPAPFRAKAE